MLLLLLLVLLLLLLCVLSEEGKLSTEVGRFWRINNLLKAVAAKDVISSLFMNNSMYYFLL